MAKRNPLPKQLRLSPQPEADAPLAEWALWCADVGRIYGAWKVFPCVPGAKHPLHKGWQAEASDDPKTIKAMWRAEADANIGLAIQPGFVAIDADLYKPGAEEALDAFEAEHGRLPRTLESRTARGGFHLVYVTEKTLGNGTGELPDFGDVRGHGGLIVGPGSVFEGKRYEVENLCPPIDLPKNIEGMLRAKKRRDPSKPDTPARFILVDDPRNQKAFEDWCAGISVRTITTPEGQVAEPCIEGQRGNNKLAATGAMAHDYGLSCDVAAEIAFEHFNPRCDPPWDDDDFYKHFQSGYRAATSQLGSRAPARDHRSMFKPVSRDTKAPERDGSRFKIWTIPELMRREPPEWQIDEVIPEQGYTILYGPPQSFKTFLALDMALSIATGTPWRGRPVKQGRVLFCMGEGTFDADKRVNAWLAHNEMKLPDSFEIIEPAPMLRMPGDLAEFIEAAEAGWPWDLVVIDTIGRTMAGLNDNATEHARMFTEFAGDIRDQLGAATLAITHSPKDRPEVLLGSGAFEADADVILNATVPESGRGVDLEQRKQKYCAPWARGLSFECVEAGESIALNPRNPTAAAAPTDKAKGRKKHDPRPNPERFAVIDKAIEEELRSNKLKEYSQTHLAEILAMRPDVLMNSEYLRQKVLKELREDKSTRANRFYNAEKRKWRWQKVTTKRRKSRVVRSSCKELCKE